MHRTFKSAVPEIEALKWDTKTPGGRMVSATKVIRIDKHVFVLGENGVIYIMTLHLRRGKNVDISRDSPNWRAFRWADALLRAAVRFDVLSLESYTAWEQECLAARKADDRRYAAAEIARQMTALGLKVPARVLWMAK